MLLLLLVSIQLRILIMELNKPQNELSFISNKVKIKSNLSENKEPILCNHCKRTSSNGIRCMGICVADNDY